MFVLDRTFAQSRSHLKVIQSQVRTLEFGISRKWKKISSQKLAKFSQNSSKFYANGNSNHEYTKLRVHCTSNCTRIAREMHANYNTRLIKNFG